MQRLRLLNPTTWDIRFWLLGLLAGGALAGFGVARIAADDGGLLLLGGALIALVSVGGVVRSLSETLDTGSNNWSGLATSIRQMRLNRAMRVVAIGGGTGLPASLRAMKAHTSNITAIVTVADDGGSSGRLRRDLGVLPPGDLRNNIAALADDESLMTKLLQYRFENGELSGHAFGNLFIAALSGVAGGLDLALAEVARVLNLRGRVLPATLDDIRLTATVYQPERGVTVRVEGESKIPEAGGHIELVTIEPATARAFPDSVRAILDAQLIVLGPGSLFTSILPSLLVPGILEALRASSAYKVYLCNVAQQPGETDGYTVADHVMALERHIGRGVFQAVLANNNYPTENAGENTVYVMPAPPHHEILQRYELRYEDLTDNLRPWRHDGVKLAGAIRDLVVVHRIGGEFV